MGRIIKSLRLENPFTTLNRPRNSGTKKSDSTMIRHGFAVNTYDSCVHSKLIGLDCVTICLYVGDMLIFGSNVHVVNETKSCCLLILK